MRFFRAENRTQLKSYKNKQPMRINLTCALGGPLLLLSAAVGLGHLFNRRRLPPAPADAALVFGTGLRW
jgi:hypothetical protein